MHGVCGCFVTTLADDFRMGNVPGDSSTSNFAQAFFPLENPIAVEAGDQVAIRVESHDGHAVRWRVEVARDGQRAHARFDQSTLAGLLLSPQSLRKQARDYHPALTARGAMERTLLDRFDGSTSAADLQKWLRERYGDLLLTDTEAESFLKATIDRSG
jgi:hypothetical protein